MSIVLQGSTSGSITLQEPAIAGSTVLSLPAISGTLITTGSTGQVIPRAALPTGSVLQVVSAIKTDVFTTTSTSFVDVTGISVTITPTSATSRILVIVAVQGSQGSGSDASFRLMRDATAIAVSTAGSSKNGFGQVSTTYGDAMFTVGVTFLDNPSTTSATTYKVQCGVNGGTAFVNRRNAGTDFGGSSTITVMEIAA